MELNLRVLSIIIVLFAATSGCAKEAAETSPPSPEVQGSFSAVISPQELKASHPDIPANLMSGRWNLEVLNGSYRLSNEGFGRVTGQLSISDNEIRFEDIPAPVGAYNCEDEQGSRILTRPEGNGTYSYELTGDDLVLTLEDEPCEFRGFLMERTWTES